jgi:hypothetical protein
MAAVTAAILKARALQIRNQLSYFSRHDQS